eukprot:TRINITY_DN2708_c0_g3_i1.p1 TRINITY_DN2708_c0_g3~~TRINITY_DN2708_c0_g3_i1.p1  ORF type:complete len:729 (-),score=345.13 TRINITY_DN2708_c0_g3_i1:200-2386(-)
MLSRAALLLALAQGGAAANADTVDKGLLDSNANPIRRVVTLLEKMAKKVEDEGEKEEKLYKKFQCYCSNGERELEASIEAAGQKSPQLSSDIEEAESEKKQLAIDLKAHAVDRESAKGAMESAEAQREKEHKEYAAQAAEHQANIGALDKAIPAIERGMSGGFLQANSGTGVQAVKKALSASQTVTEYDRELVVAFLEGTRATDASGVEYVPKSGEISGILKSLKEDFEKTLAEVEDAEKQSKKAFDQLMAAKTKQVQTLSAGIEKKTKRVGDLGVQIVTMKNDLTDTQAALEEDKKLAGNLEETCKEKAAEWDERQKTRGEELVAIHDTIKILNDDDALELFKKALPSASLLQVGQGQNKEQLRRTALSLLESAKAPGTRTGLDFLALALSGKKVDFGKVIKMIDDMVALLKQAQRDDDDKQEYCKIQMDNTEDKIKELDKKIESLQAGIADAEETIGAMETDTKALRKGIKELDDQVQEASEQRQEEHAEYVELMSNNNAAKELLNFAKNRLNKFYQPSLYKAPAKRELSDEEQIFVNNGGTLSPTPAPGGIAGTGISAFLQTAQEKADPAPVTWDGSYKKSGETNSVISMIDLLIRDLDKDITEAETDEKHAQSAYEKMMQDAAQKRAADVKAISANEASKAEAESEKEASVEDERLSQGELKATKMYDMNLHSECDWIMQYYDLRKDARTEETESLKQAKAVLAGADFSLVQTAAKQPVKQHSF